MREEGESLAHTLTRELHEETGLVITAAHAPWLVWSRLSLSQYAGARLRGARLERKVLRWWYQSWRRRPTQVIAEHAARGEQATDEGGRALAQKATPEPKGWADVRKAAAQAAVKASEKTGRPVDERVKKLAES